MSTHHMQAFLRRRDDAPTIVQTIALVVRVAVGVVFYNASWSIEEFVIDRHGLWKYMPYYKVADACAWDLAVALFICLAIWAFSRRQDSTAL